MPNDGTDTKWKAVDFLHLSVFSFGSTSLSTALGVLVLPVLVLNIAPEDMKNTYLGVLSLAGLVVAMVVQPLAGHISDRTSFAWGRRTPYILVGGLLTSLSILSLGASSGFFILMGILMVTQLCMNMALGPYYALIRDLAPQARRGVVSSFKLLADSSGGVAALVSIAFLLGLYTATGRVFWLWLSLGIISLILGVTTAWTAIGIRGKDINIAPVVVSLGASQLQRRAQAGFGWFLGSRVCSFAAMAVLQTYAVFFLQDVVGLTNPVRAVGTMTIFIGGSLLLAVYPFGKLSDQIGRKKVILASSLVASGGVFALLLATSSLHVLLIGSVLGASAGAFLSASWAMATDMVSSGRTAQQMGITNAAAVGGTALAKLAGPGVDLLNRIETDLGYTILLAACGLLFIIGAMLLLPVQSNSVAMPHPAVSEW